MNKTKQLTENAAKIQTLAADIIRLNKALDLLRVSGSHVTAKIVEEDMVFKMRNVVDCAVANFAEYQSAIERVESNTLDMELLKFAESGENC